MPSISDSPQIAAYISYGHTEITCKLKTENKRHHDMPPLLGLARSTKHSDFGKEF